MKNFASTTRVGNQMTFTNFTNFSTDGNSGNYSNSINNNDNFVISPSNHNSNLIINNVDNVDNIYQLATTNDNSGGEGRVWGEREGEEKHQQGEKRQQQEEEDDNNCNRCPDCGKEFASLNSWCRFCSINQLKQQFLSWTSGNRLIDELIRGTQLKATSSCSYLEWIPFENIELREFKSEGGYSAIYSAIWLEGPKWIYDEASGDYTRTGPTKVALKRFNNLNSVTIEFINQVKRYLNCLQCGSLAECFGITKDSTSCYMFVMKYYENGNLYQYLDYVKGVISWRDMIDMLWGISCGLEKIHAQDLFHGNLHGGNLLIEEENVSTDAKLADVGFYGPVSDNLSFKRNNNKIYGVLPFIAPEILQLPLSSSDDYDYNDKQYCYLKQKSDIYSFGITMWTLASGVKPWHERAHSERLAIDICNGLRPKDIPNMPKYYKDLMEQCWHPSWKQRPTAKQLTRIFSEWIYDMCDNMEETDISREFSKAEEERWKLISRQHNKAYNHPRQHTQAVYTSREIHFPNLINKINKNKN